MTSQLWQLKENARTYQWYLSFSEVPIEGQFPSYEEIVEVAKTQGIDEKTLIRKELLLLAFQKMSESKVCEPIPIQLSPKFDAKIIVSSDNLQAQLYIRKSADKGQPINMRMITTMLSSSEIKNIDMQAVQEEIAQFAHTDEREFLYTIASGTAPTRGAERTLISHISEIDEKTLQTLLPLLRNSENYTNDEDNPNTDADFPLHEAEHFYAVSVDDILYEFSPAEKGEDGLDIYGKTIASLPGNDPYIIDLRNISQVSNRLLAEKTGILLACATDRGVKMRVIPFKHARVRAAVSRDHLEVSLFLEEGRGAGKKLSPSLIEQALQEMKVAQHPAQEKIEDAIARAGRAFGEIEYVIIRGVDPFAENSYRLQWKVDLGQHNTAVVKKDTVVLEAVFHSEGEAGLDVFGNTIPASRALPQALPHPDESISVTDIDGKKIYMACISGELKKINNSLSISSEKIINTGVDTSMGSIDFPADLTISGDIGNGVSIVAGGMLTITGNAGVNRVCAHDSLKLSGGMYGGSKGILWATNTIHAQFAENARIYCGKTITLERYCFRCTVKTNDKLIIVNKPGAIVGGNIHATRGVSVTDIGAYKTIKTLISFGQDYLIKDAIEVHEKEIKENDVRLSIIESELASSKTVAEDLVNLRSEKVTLLKRNKALRIRIFNLKENFESHIESELTVTGTAYPGTVLESHGRYFEVTEPLSYVVFSFNQEKGQITYRQIDEP